MTRAALLALALLTGCTDHNDQDVRFHGERLCIKWHSDLIFAYGQPTNFYRTVCDQWEAQP